MAHETYIAGVKFRPGAQGVLDTLERPQQLELVREPNNPHDSNAIRVEHGPHFLGYVPADDARTIAPKMDAGQQATCTLQSGKRIEIEIT